MRHSDVELFFSRRKYKKVIKILCQKSTLYYCLKLGNLSGKNKHLGSLFLSKYSVPAHLQQRHEIHTCYLHFVIRVRPMCVPFA